LTFWTPGIALDSSSWWLFRWYCRFGLEDDASAFKKLSWVREGGMVDRKMTERGIFETIVWQQARLNTTAQTQLCVKLSHNYFYLLALSDGDAQSHIDIVMGLTHPAV
jgi:hypothetical protein